MAKSKQRHRKSQGSGINSDAKPEPNNKKKYIRKDIREQNLNIELAQRAFKNYQDGLHSGSKRKASYWKNRLAKLEEPLRLEANRRLRSVLKQGIGENMGWYDNLFAYIENQADLRDRQGERKIFAPQSIDETYENILQSAKFIRSMTSTPQGVRKVIMQIREEVPDYRTKNMSDNEFYEFWKWRNLNPVHEFFKMFPPSPPELQGSIGTMVIDLWNSGEEARNMMEDYFEQFQLFLKTQEEDWTEGLPPSLLAKKLDELYYKTKHNRRRY